MIITSEEVRPTTVLADLAEGLHEIMKWVTFPSLTALEYGMEKLRNVEQEKAGGFSGWMDFPALINLPQKLLPNPFESMDVKLNEQVEVVAEDPCKKYFLQKWNKEKGECELDVPMIILLGSAALALGMVIAR